jgi:hypothetical protein
MRPAMLVLAIALIATQGHAQADSAADVFHKVTDSSHTSSSSSDVFRRAAQARDAAQNRPDVIATDPNQVEAQVVRRDSIDILHRAPATAAAAAPAAATPPVPAGVAALGAAFTAAGPPDDPKPTEAPKARRAPASTNGSIAHKPAPVGPAAPPVEHATVVTSGTAPAITRMGAMPAPAAPEKPVFNDTVTTLEREAATVSQDVAPRYANERATMDSVRDKHNAKLDSLEATESTIKDSTERRFEHKMAEAARLKTNKAHSDSAAKQH